MVVDGKSLQEYPVKAGVLHRSIPGPVLFLLYIDDLPNIYVICNIAIYTNDSTLYSKCEQPSILFQQLKLASELEFDLQYTLDWGKKLPIDFNAIKTQLVLFDGPINPGAIDVKIDGSILEEKSSFRC